MPEFSYEALNESNEPTSGRESAESVAAAIAQLEAQGLQVLSISQINADAAPAKVENTTTADSALGDDQQAFRERVAEVLENRDILAPALAAFAEELPRGLSRRELRRLVARLNAGATVEEFCQADDPITTWLPLLGGWKSSQGLLSDMFAEATHANETRTQWFRALLYPLFVFLAALGVFIFLCIIVVPTFKTIFEDFDMDLPAMTVGILQMSGLILQNPARLFLIVLLVILGFYLLLRVVSIWGLPGRLWNGLTTGNSQQVSAAARFTRRLAEALDADMSLPTALRLAGRGERSSRTRQAALQLAHDAEHASFDLKESSWARYLPATVVHALQAGPERKPNTRLVQQLAELYTARVRDRCEWSTGFMAQLAIVGMGLTVGVVVLSLLLPLVQLINGLTG